MPVVTKKFFGAIGFLLILVFEHFDFVGRPEVVADVGAHVVGVGVFVALTVVTFWRLFDAQIWRRRRCDVDVSWRRAWNGLNKNYSILINFFIVILRREIAANDVRDK